MKFKGIVIKTKDSHHLVLASDGTYHKVPLSKYKGARVGSEIEFAVNSWHRYLKPALLVASILVIAMGLSLFQQAAIPPAFAYVSLDINPSVELEVDQNLKVIAVHPLNRDAEKLLSNIDISDQQLNASVSAIVAEAVYEGFLKAEQKNYILSTVTLADASSKDADYSTFADELNSGVQNNSVEVELLVLAADSKLHQEAKTKGLSTGKLMVYHQAETAGQKVTLKQVKENSITNLVNNYKVKLEPSEKQLIIKTHKALEKKETGRKDRPAGNGDRPGKSHGNDDKGKGSNIGRDEDSTDNTDNTNDTGNNGSNGKNGNNGNNGKSGSNGKSGKSGSRNNGISDDVGSLENDSGMGNGRSGEDSGIIGENGTRGEDLADDDGGRDKDKNDHPSKEKSSESKSGSTKSDSDTKQNSR